MIRTAAFFAADLPSSLTSGPTDDETLVLRVRALPIIPVFKLLRALFALLRGDFFLLCRRPSGFPKSPRFPALEECSSGCPAPSHVSEKNGTSCRPYPGNRALGRLWQASIILSSNRSSSPLNIFLDTSTWHGSTFATAADAIVFFTSFLATPKAKNSRFPEKNTPRCQIKRIGRMKRAICASCEQHNWKTDQLPSTPVPGTASR